MKKFIFSVLTVFFLLCIMDFVINKIILDPIYNQMSSILVMDTGAKIFLIYLANIVHAIALVTIYNMFAKKTVKTGLLFGILYGLSYGFGFGFGFYAVMPTALSIIVAWIISAFMEISLVGLIIGYMNKEK